MSGNERTCPGCGSASTRKDGRDRKGQQRFHCGCCRCRFTALTGTPLSGYRFPPDVIALAVRWYPRYRLSYADVAELLAERVSWLPSPSVPLYSGTGWSRRPAIGVVQPSQHRD